MDKRKIIGGTILAMIFVVWASSMYISLSESETCKDDEIRTDDYCLEEESKTYRELDQAPAGINVAAAFSSYILLFVFFLTLASTMSRRSGS